MFKGDADSFQIAEGGGSQPSTAISTSFVLSLPKIDSGVPAAYLQAGHPSIVLLARQLANIGALTRQDIADGADIDTAVKQVFRREMEAALGDMKVISLDVEMSDGGMVDEDVAIEHDAGEHERFLFEMSILGTETLVIGKALFGLEEICCGLGETVFAVLQRVAQSSLGLFTFDFILEEQPWVYCLEEREDGESDPDESGDDGEWEGMPSRTDLLEGAGFSWANKPEWVLGPMVLSEIRNRTSTPIWARRILDFTLNAADAWVSGHGTLGKVAAWGVEAAYQLAVVRFSEEDQLERMYHDHIQNCNGSSDYWTAYAHMELVDIRDTVKFKTWWEGVLAGCRLVSAIDALLDALTYQPTE